MEIFADFGLFEVIAAAALLVVVRWIFRTKTSSIAFLAVAVVSAVATMILAPEGVARWVAAVSLASTLIATSVLGAIVACTPGLLADVASGLLKQISTAAPRPVRSFAARVRGGRRPRS